MRRIVVGLAAFGLAAVLAGCVGPYGQPHRVDPEDAADRAVIGSAVGAALGAGLGATIAIDPALGAVIGAESGALAGAAVGAATAQPIPAYAPIPPAVAVAVPHYYDNWPPGYHPPPVGSEVPPPPPPN